MYLYYVISVIFSHSRLQSSDMVMRPLLSCKKTGEKTCKKLFAVSQALLAPVTALPFKATATLVCLLPWCPSVTSITSLRPQRTLKLWLSTLLGLSSDPLISFRCHTLIFWLVIRWPGLGPGCEKPLLPFSLRHTHTHTHAGALSHAATLQQTVSICFKAASHIWPWRPQWKQEPPCII